MAVKERSKRKKESNKGTKLVKRGSKQRKEAKEGWKEGR